MPNILDHIMRQEDLKMRFLKETSKLEMALKLAMPSKEAIAIRDEVGLFLAVRSSLIKNSRIVSSSSKRKIDSAINQLISKAIASDKIMDIFDAAGIKNKETPILSESFLNEVSRMKQKNLAVEALQKLLDERIRTYRRKNITTGKSFMDMLEKTINQYTNHSLKVAEVVRELIDLARRIRSESERSKKFGLTEDELAFYDALAVNDSAKTELGDTILMDIARDLTEILKRNTSIDWTQKPVLEQSYDWKSKNYLKIWLSTRWSRKCYKSCSKPS